MYFFSENCWGVQCEHVQTSSPSQICWTLIDLPRYFFDLLVWSELFDQCWKWLVIDWRNHLENRTDWYEKENIFGKSLRNTFRQAYLYESTFFFWSSHLLFPELDKSYENKIHCFLIMLARACAWKNDAKWVILKFEEKVWQMKIIYQHEWKY